MSVPDIKNLGLDVFFRFRKILNLKKKYSILKNLKVHFLKICPIAFFLF